MQNIPEIELNRLKNNKQTNKTIRRIYSNFYSVEFYRYAFKSLKERARISEKKAEPKLSDIENIIKRLRNGTYEPNPNVEASFSDVLVEEIIRLILCNVYDEKLSKLSYSRCDECLNDVRTKFQGSVWFIQGTLNGYDNVNHDLLFRILRAKIDDLRFIHLINLFLKAGYLRNLDYTKTYSGTPVGSVLSEILPEIYFNELDKYFETEILKFNKGTRPKDNPEYHRIHSKITKARKYIATHDLTDPKIPDKLNTIHENKKKQKAFTGPTHDPLDPNYKKLRYVRYKNEYLLGIIGSKTDATLILQNLAQFLETNLKITCSQELYHRKNKIRFLGYDIVEVRHSLKKVDNGNIKLSVPHDILVDIIINKHFGKYFQSKETNKTEIKAIARSDMLPLEPLEILYTYNTLWKSVYNFYSLAENTYKLGRFGYILQVSYLRTLAGKYRTSVAKLYKNRNYCQNKRIGCIHPIAKDFREFFVGPFKKKSHNPDFSDLKPNLRKLYGNTSLVSRLQVTKCALCGSTEGPFELHHIHQMKDTKEKETWQRITLGRLRKQIPLCKKCHSKIHHS